MNMMIKNKHLTRAKIVKNDEFYTQYSDISEELNNYIDCFYGKNIYLNCDNPKYSNFWKYFKDNYKTFELRRLTSTYLVNGGCSYKTTISHEKDKIIEEKEIILSNGDFRSEPCVNILKNSDFIITNPPFSLIDEYYDILMKYNKQFLIIVNQNVITKKRVFADFKNNKVWFGYNHGSMSFLTPNNDIKKFGNIAWLTNIGKNENKPKLNLAKSYIDNKNDYPKYENLDAIEVSKLLDIPYDYDGMMGVPITYIYKHNPSQFEIIGSSNSKDNLKEAKPLGKSLLDEFFEQGGKGHYTPGMTNLSYRDKDGKIKMPYARVVIKRK